MWRILTDNVLYILLGFYTVLTVGFLAQRKWAMFLYFLGAAILIVGVVLLNKESH